MKKEQRRREEQKAEYD
jgi:hypothetical protein